ncbi:hypothetical protein A2Z33_00275 [Candidatus Gottesmanbacteria bacterium RBG_16_52_11]|uniref:LytR/CpsA/Psr regulator C-terminal domain-containing protein n=1 Tax=Candidatus Gottesmanbacteria bacterium RBG_16_52_11 TaxID=1798374 RepID=A0A1F5YNI3_9BACT|nr:MAG: hypothetical protein A2Z33_00275 [Candidatus Gottesmanbacteria bacterium RBG_16_52_11]
MTSGRKKLTVGLIFVLVIAALGTSLYFFVQYRRTQALLKNPAEAAKLEQQQILKKIATLIDLPAGEEPTAATITDVSKLKDQPFFSTAVVGDRLFFFPNAKRAILYRPSTGKIIKMTEIQDSPVTNPEVAGAAVTPAPGTATPSPTPVKKFNLAIYNGTTTPRLANNLETFLTGRNAPYTVVSKANAAKQDPEYPGTLVIDLTGSEGAAADSLAALIGGKTGTLPAGETKPEADLLVILGRDYSPNPTGQ